MATRKKQKKTAKAPQPPRGRGGPRLRLTPERMGRIISYKRIGAPDIVAYRMANVSEKTFYRWRGYGEAVMAALSEEGRDAWESIAMLAADILHGPTPAGRTEPFTWGEAREGALHASPEEAMVYFDDLRRAAKGLKMHAFHADVYLQFTEAIRRAEAESELECVSTIRFNVTTKKNWVAAMTFLERRWPERWRKRTEVDIGRKSPETTDHEQGREVARQILASPEATKAHNQALAAIGRAHPLITGRARDGDDG